MPEDKRQNEIIRIQKKRNNFVMLDKGFLEDSHLSYKAKGILAYLLSKPDNWKVIVKDLINHSSDGKKAIYSGLRELKEYGYYKKIPIRDEKGQRISHWESVIFECPEEQPEPQSPEPRDNDENYLLLQKGEVDTNTVNSTSSLFTPFVYIDNVKIQNEDIQNRQRNNNYISNNNYSDIKSKSSQSQTNKTDLTLTPDIDLDTTKQTNFPETKERLLQTTAGQSTGLQSPSRNTQYPLDDYIMYKALIQDNIEYNYYIHNRQSEIDLIDELINCMLDVICTKGDTVKINGEEKSRNMVKSQYLKINSTDIDHILDRYKSQHHKITHLHSYLKTMLYTVKQENIHYYSNAVRIDL